MKKAILIILAVITLIISSVLLQVFVIGEPADSSILYCDVTEDDDQINIFVFTPSSAIAFTDDVTLRQEETTLYITLCKVLVSSLYNDGTKQIWIEKNDLTTIYLGGKQIWSVE